MKIIWISDLHFEPSDLVPSGVDPTARIQTVIDEIVAHHTDAAYCIINGDLTNSDDPTHYAKLKVILDQIPLPLLPLVGNHDQRKPLVDVFAPPVDPNSDFVHYFVDTPDGRLICLDTLTIDQGYGSFCDERYAWLEESLTSAASAPCYLFMHHPPAKLGLGLLDEICLTDSDEFIRFVSRFSNVRHIFSGHVHRPISASIAGIPLTVMCSTRYQAPLPYPAWDWDTFAEADEAPMYGILQIRDGNSIVQFKQF